MGQSNQKVVSCSLIIMFHKNNKSYLCSELKKIKPTQQYMNSLMLIKHSSAFMTILIQL